MVVFWERADPVSETSPLVGGAAVEFAGSVYIFGGFAPRPDAPPQELRHEVFNAASGEWAGVAELDVAGDVPTPRAGCTATRCRGTVYLFGGQQLWPATQLDDFYAATIVTPGVVQWEQLLGSTPLLPAGNFTEVI